MKLNDNFNFRKQIVGNLRLTDRGFSFIFSRLATHFIFRAPSLPSHAQTRGDGGGKIDKKNLQNGNVPGKHPTLGKSCTEEPISEEKCRIVDLCAEGLEGLDDLSRTWVRRE